MRIGIVSDIHGNAAGLAAALARLESVDRLLCAGDIQVQYRFSEPVIGLLREWEALAVLGNHDKVLLSPHGAGVRRGGRGSAEAWAWLAAQPAARRLAVDGLRLLLAHGAPWDDPASLHATYIYPTDAAGLRRVASYDADVVVLGHTHYPLLHREGATLIVNPGSCGEARDRGLLTYAVLDTAAGTATLYRLDDGHAGAVLATAPLGPA